MKNELKTIQEQTVAEKTIDDFLFGSETKLTDPQKTLFKEMAIASNLNPFKREIYPVSFNGRMSIVTGYQVYIDRANKSGMLDGWNAEVIGEGKSAVAKVTIYRKDWTHPFVHEVYASEVAKEFGIWKSSPKFMLKKVAIGQGFRLAFPSELGGLPYTEDELNDGKNEQLPTQTLQQKAEATVIETTTPQKPEATKEESVKTTRKKKENVNEDKFDEIVNEMDQSNTVEGTIVDEIFPDKVEDTKEKDDKETVLGAYILHVKYVKNGNELKEATKKFLQEYKMVKDHPMRDVVIQQYEELKMAFVE